MYAPIPGAAQADAVSEKVIMGYANISQVANRFTITSCNENGLYHAVRTCVMFCMFYVDALDWDSIEISAEEAESKTRITIEIPGKVQRIEMMAFLKNSFNYSKYLNKMEKLMMRSLIPKFGIENDKVEVVNRAIKDIQLEYIKWDYNYGNMALPVYDFDLFYNLIKRIYQQTSKKEKSVRISTGFNFIAQMMNMNQRFIDYLYQIDEYYKIDSNSRFSEIFEQCPFVQWIQEEKDEDVMNSIGYIFKNMIADVANANKLERSGDDIPTTEI